MYKIKTKKGAAKRFKVSKNNKVKFFGAKRKHNLSTRDSQALRQSKGGSYLKKGDANLLLRYYL